MRKNVSAMRNQTIAVGQTTQPVGKNGQRVSQQRRFNNTTLDNYQVQMAQQMNTIQAKAPQPGQSRSVLRNQQQQKYLHNYLPSNAFQPATKEMRINNQLIAQKQEARTGSTIRNGQNVSNTIVVSKQHLTNNYLQQQQEIGNIIQGGQSPLLKQNL